MESSQQVGRWMLLAWAVVVVVSLLGAVVVAWAAEPEVVAAEFSGTDDKVPDIWGDTTPEWVWRLGKDNPSGVLIKLEPGHYSVERTGLVDRPENVGYGGKQNGRIIWEFCYSLLPRLYQFTGKGEWSLSMSRIEDCS